MMKSNLHPKTDKEHLWECGESVHERSSIRRKNLQIEQEIILSFQGISFHLRLWHAECSRSSLV
jgi:hypothetical protein